MYKALCLITALAGLFAVARTHADGASTSTQSLATTGVYFGYCNGAITQNAMTFGSVNLYAFGNLTDPNCGDTPTHLAPVPFSANGFLADLEVASEEEPVICQCVTPSAVTV
jgi:hypothetical protein